MFLAHGGGAPPQADELDQNKDGRILKSDLEDFVRKLKGDESFITRSRSSALLCASLQ